jgi:hypothetical protein
MHDENVSAIEIRNEVFCPAPKCLNAPAGQPLGETLGKGKPQVGTPLVNCNKPRPDHRWLKPKADCFDFGQLRHLLASSFWSITIAPQLPCWSNKKRGNSLLWHRPLCGGVTDAHIEVSAMVLPRRLPCSPDVMV